MSIPITGILLIPFGLLIALLPWRYCLIGLVSFSMMSPAAVVNFGHIGLQPGYYLSILLMGRAGLSSMMRGFTLNSFVIERMKPLLALVPLTMSVLFLACCFFQGEVMTLRGSSGYKSGLTQPFHLSKENFAQLAYLLSNVSLVYVLGQEGARQPPPTLFRDWDHALCIGLCFAASVCAWQFLALYGGIWFPSEFFYSNAGYGRSEAQSMVGLFRINGPFEEPSTLGYVFTGYLLFAWRRYQLFPTAFSACLIAASVICLTLSTSTTAFFGLFLVACLAMWDIFSGKVVLLTRDFRLSSGQVAAIGIVLSAILLGSIIVAAYGQRIFLILQVTVFHKTATASFQQRVFAELLGLRIFVETYGIGVGLGSHKANSLAVTLLSNVGFIGFSFFVAGACNLLWPARGQARRLGPQARILARALPPFQSALLGLLLVHLFSNPLLSSVFLWVTMGGILAIRASAHRAASGISPQRHGAALEYLPTPSPLPSGLRAHAG